jgi:hypothetical protein
MTLMISPLPGDMSQDPLARAVLRKLAETYPKEQPLASFARTVLSGEASLWEAARHPWHDQALGRAFADATAARRDLSEAERSAIEKAADRLRKAVEAEADDTEAGQAFSDPGGARRGQG